MFYLLTILLLVTGSTPANANASFSAPAQDDLFPGSPPIVPLWAFEPWAWEDNTNTRASTENLVEGYLSRDIPVGAVIIDSPWETHYNSLVWDASRFPDPAGMIAGFHEQDVRVVMWITGFINTGSPDYSYVKQNNFGVHDSQDFTWWWGKGIHLDFTNPRALAWWNAKLDAILDMGVDGWKVDMSADYLPDPVKTSIGMISRQDFKKYYYGAFYDHGVSRSPSVVTVARPYSWQGGAGAAVSQLTLGWSGDYTGDFAGLRHQMAEVYESARLGYGAPGVEIGGYDLPAPDKQSLIRHAQLAALTPFMENGGKNGGEKEHLPWIWDTEATGIYRYFAALHSELAPYLFSYGVEAHMTGRSILRQPETQRAQHKLGEELFASPVVTRDAVQKTIHFPSGGRWINYWDEDNVYEGGTTHTFDLSLSQIPLFIRSGAVIPLNVRSDLAGHGDETSAGKVTLLVYPDGVSSFRFHRPLGDGIEYSTVDIQVDELFGVIRVSGAQAAAYRLRVKSFTRPLAVNGADHWSYDAASQVITIDKTGASFSLSIPGLKGYGPETGGPVDPVVRVYLPVLQNRNLD